MLMSESNPSNPTGSNRPGATAGAFQTPDFAQLSVLLGNLMPLLMRFQFQVLESPVQAGPGSPHFQQPLFPQPMLDHQAAVLLVEDIAAGPLRTLTSYLEVNAPKNSALGDCVPLVTRAKQSFAAHEYGQALNLIWLAYRAITMIQASDPKVPPLQTARQESSDQFSSLH
jgi:hypothetical protein